MSSRVDLSDKQAHALLRLAKNQSDYKTLLEVVDDLRMKEEQQLAKLAVASLVHEDTKVRALQSSGAVFAYSVILEMLRRPNETGE